MKKICDEEINWDELVRQIHYNPVTGIFTRKVAISNNSKVGDILSGYHSGGYATVCVFGRKFLAHRLAWFYHYKVWPSQEIDHINHNRKDNRIENLREVSSKENSRNQAFRSTNTSGYTGLKQFKEKWEARISTDSGVKVLGWFNTFEEALAARSEAEQTYGYHPNHGRHAKEDM